MARHHSKSVELTSAEVDREISDIAQRQSNAISRASLLLAAAGLTVYLSGSGAGVVAAAVLGSAAAIAALLAIVLWNSKAVTLEMSIAGLWIASEPDLLAERILVDKVKELIRVRGDLDLKNRCIALALFLVLASWVCAGAARLIG